VKSFRFLSRWPRTCAWVTAAWLPLSAIAQGADDDLAKQIQDLTRRINPNFDSAVNTERDDLISALECAFPEAKPVSVENKVLCQQLAIETHLKRILDSAGADVDGKKKLQDDTLKFLLKSKVLVDSDLKKTLTAVLNPDPGPDPARIHIVAAYYGHLDDIAYDLKYFHLEPKLKQPPATSIGPRFFNDLSQHSYISDRFCVATRAVRALCQGQKFCFEAIPVPFTGTTLCGFEPAPYAEPRMKGLIIRYRCDSKKDWRPESDIIEDDEDIIPSGPDSKITLKDNPIKSTKDAEIGVPQWALLRPGETTKIICTLPPAAKTAAQ
jgi:hypothetical protein